MCGIKWCQSYSMICKDPAKWFGNVTIDARDKALLTGNRESFVEYSQQSCLSKIYSMKKTGNAGFICHDWTVENNEECKDLIYAAGGELNGLKQSKESDYCFMTTMVAISGTEGAGYFRGMLSTHGKNVRYFKGPKETCDLHPWDAIILRDCTANTDNLYELEPFISRKFDVMVMKMCEDFDHPWVVVCVKDAGKVEPEPLGERCINH